LKSAIEIAERAQGGICQARRADDFVDHQREASVARDAAELNGEVRTAWREVFDYRQYSTIAD
jgi:hypothetical protein